MLIKTTPYQFFLFIFKDIRDQLDHSSGSRALMHYIGFRLVLKLFLIFFDNLEAINLVKEVCKSYSFHNVVENNDEYDDFDDDEDEYNNHDEEHINEKKETFFSNLFSKKTNLYEIISIEYKAIPALNKIIQFKHRSIDFFSVFNLDFHWFVFNFDSFSLSMLWN